MNFVRAICVLFVVAFFSSSAFAFSFGRSEVVHPLVDVGVKGPNGEALYLGYKVTFHSFLAPYAVQDDGYVLGVKGNYKQYLQLPMSDHIRSLQQAGLMPNPFPTYELTQTDYFYGHLLWFALPLVIALVAGRAWWDASRQKKGANGRALLWINTHMERYIANPPTLPMTLKGKSLIPGANDLVIKESGFAFTSVGGPNDLTHWPDIGGFTLGKLSGKTLANWRYSQEFRGLSLEQLQARTDGLSQSAIFGPCQQVPEEVIGLLNAVWLMHRDKTPSF